MMVMMATASTSPLRVLRSADSHLRCLPVGSTHSIERRPTHFASESFNGVLLLILAFCDDIAGDEVAEITWIFRRAEGIVKVRVRGPLKQHGAIAERREYGARQRSEVVPVDGTLARRNVQRTDMCLHFYPSRLEINARGDE